MISKLPIASNHKLQLFGLIKRVGWYFKYDKEKYRFFVENQVFCNSNHYYGHEFWLKKYSRFPDKIYGIIEHGVYFGDNRTLVCPKEEWDTGSVITYGDSRIDLLKELHPDKNVYAIGPRIHYAETDMEYYDELYNQIDHTGKVLTIFPAHSLAETKSIYDSELFLKQAEELANRIGAKTIMVSLHPSDFIHKLNLSFEGRKLIFVGGGTTPHKFLPRLRAVISISDLTFSNRLGTHIGYSVYMGVPHVLNTSSNMNARGNEAFEKEQSLFEKTFNGAEPLNITEEQRKLCDYYYGFSHIKTPGELYNILVKCKNKFETKYYKKNSYALYI